MSTPNRKAASSKTSPAPKPVATAADPLTQGAGDSAEKQPKVAPAKSGDQVATSAAKSAGTPTAVDGTAGNAYIHGLLDELRVHFVHLPEHFNAEANRLWSLIKQAL